MPQRERHRARREQGMNTWSCSCGAGPFPFEGGLAMTEAFREHVEEVRRDDELEDALGAMFFDVSTVGIEGWHRKAQHGGQGGETGHGSFTDSLALTHCICFGSMASTLSALAKHPELLARLNAAAETYHR